MDGSDIGLFLHIVGGLGFFVALGLEWTGLAQMRSTILPEQIRAWTEIFKNARRVLFVSMLMIVLTGVYSMLAEFGTVAWIIVPLGSFVLVIALLVALTDPQMAAIRRALEWQKGSVSQTLHGLASHPLLWLSVQTRVAIGLGIVFLMIVKPDWLESLLTIGVAIVLGLASAIPVLRRERAQAVSAD